MAVPRQPREPQVTTRIIEDVRIDRHGRGLHIVRPWARSSGYAGLLWIVLWLGVTGFLTSLSPHPGPAGNMLLALPALAMGYVALSRFLNRTEIDVGPAEIVLRHRPLPWPGARRFPTRDVRGLTMAIKKIYAKGGPYDECRIYVVHANGRKSMLVKGLEMSAPQMEGLAVAIAEHLDVPLSVD